MILIPFIAENCYNYVVQVMTIIIWFMVDYGCFERNLWEWQKRHLNFTRQSEWIIALVLVMLREM